MVCLVKGEARFTADLHQGASSRFRYIRNTSKEFAIRITTSRDSIKMKAECSIQIIALQKDTTVGMMFVLTRPPHLPTRAGSPAARRGVSPPPPAAAPGCRAPRQATAVCLPTAGSEPHRQTGSEAHKREPGPAPTSKGSRGHLPVCLPTAISERSMQNP
jgi:hypothetical protein